MSLRDQGFRFIVRDITRGGEGPPLALGVWLDPVEVKPGDIDATDMPDDEFESLWRVMNGSRPREHT